LGNHRSVIYSLIYFKHTVNPTNHTHQHHQKTLCYCWFRVECNVIALEDELEMTHMDADNERLETFRNVVSTRYMYMQLAFLAD